MSWLLEGLREQRRKSSHLPPALTDEYVLSPTYTDPDGRTIDSTDGLTVHSGSKTLYPNGIQTRSSNTFRFGSSYASNNEVWQLRYDGTAYASGKQDFLPSGSIKKKRVLQVCFKYTRDGKDLIGWQCSNAALGPLFTPGKVVKKSVMDSLGIFDSKTVFRYSYKTV